MSPLFISTQSALSESIDRWRAAPFLALDTEFVREQTYHPQLCLVQVGTGDSNACIDMLAGLDFQPLWNLLVRPGALRVFHAGGQDLEILGRHAGACPDPLFDTQVAAAMLGYGEQLGYAGLVEAMTGVRLDKSLSRADWSLRPLGPKEIAYAADDVRYLAQIYPRLEEELDQRGRLAWLREDCRALAVPARYRASPQTEWKRLKGLVRLEPAAQHVAARLAEWREVLAEQRDRPRRWILPDEAIYALAERRPRTLDQLVALAVLPPKSLDRHAETLLALIQQAADSSAPALVVEVRASDAEKLKIKCLIERVRTLALELGVPPSLLAPRAEIEALMADGANANIGLLRGWRREVAGIPLLQMMA
ncbi:MAG: ribonuclease D [Panacagrimonas sp.]